MLPIAILSGGLATRLHPITKTIPKSLVEVAGEPFIVHQLRELARQGIKDVVLCVGYFGEQIEEFVQDGTEYGLCVRYSYETNKLLGTGGAIKNALSLLGEAFFVLYGDSWLKIDFQSVYQSFQQRDCLALITVFRNDSQWDTSNVEIEEGHIKLYSKTRPNYRMTHIDYGLGILKYDLFETYKEGAVFDLADIYESLSESGNLFFFEATHRFYEIGSHVGLAELNYLMQQKKDSK